MSTPRLFGLIGYPLSHSFSKRYFTEKFEREGLPGCRYELFPLPDVDQLPSLLIEQPHLCGLNVTIPYKERVIPYLDELDPGAAAVGAVNTIRIKDGHLKGYNTDVHGFEQSLRVFLGNAERSTGGLRALILGTGGAAKAVAYVLQRLNIDFRLASRRPAGAQLGYDELNETSIQEYRLIINTTPLGMAPHTEQMPALPYTALTPRHLLYDLVYNPAETAFLKAGKKQGASTTNGLEMLYLQAEKAWEHWNR